MVRKMYPTVIKDEAQYREYLHEIERIASRDPEPGTQDGERLQLLSVLVEAYESERVSFPLPDPIDAVLFRMEEQGLKQKDLVKYLGSKSRVSEVLSGKRNLSISMIRALSSGLGIPAHVLLSEPPEENPADEDEELETIDFSKFPIAEMKKRGWLGEPSDNPRETALDAVKAFLNRVDNEGPAPVYCKRTMHFGGDVIKEPNRYRLHAWLAAVIVKSRDLRQDMGKFTRPSSPTDFLRNVATLSWSDKGPRLAKEYLHKAGICLVTERHLSKTYLDGAATLDRDGVPVIGLTLRYDRLDNFWFTLLHELAHVLFHLKKEDEAFVDNTHRNPDGEQLERQANRYAQEAFIPRSVWKRSEAYLRPSKKAIVELAEYLNIHPAIIAGRIHTETGNYALFPDLVGRKEVRRQFDIGD